MNNDRHTLEQKEAHILRLYKRIESAKVLLWPYRNKTKWHKEMYAILEGREALNHKETK